MKKYINSKIFLLTAVLCNNAFSSEEFKEDLLYSSAPIPKVVHDSSGRVETQRWPDGIVPYKFAFNEYNEEEKQAIKDAMDYLQKNANVSFREVSGDPDNYVTIAKYQKGKDYQSCYSFVGKIRKKQSLFIGDHCIYRYGEYDDDLKEFKKVFFYGGILHELMHLLGVSHEQSRTDRDDYIVYINENFHLYPRKKMENDNDYRIKPYPFSSSVTDYDYASIMQYNPYAGQKSGTTLPVMIPKKCLPQYLRDRDAFKYENLENLQGCEELKLMSYESDELSRLDICTLQFMYGEPQGVPNPVNCSDVLRRVSGVTEVAQSSGEKKVSEDKLLSKRSPPKSDSNKQSKVNKSLFTEGDEFDIENCKRSKKFSSDWKTYQEGDVLSYYQYLSEEVGSCKQEIHSYTYNKVTNSWSGFPSKKTIDLN